MTTRDSILAAVHAGLGGLRAEPDAIAAEAAGLLADLDAIRPLLRTVLPPPAKAETGAGAAGEEALEEGEEGVRVTLSGEAGEGEETETFEQRLERARTLARNDPRMVANLIKDWMGMNEEARK